MEITKQTCSKDSDLISASEIGQFHYCSIAWYLQKCGYTPKSQKLYAGTKKHIELGRILEHTQSNSKKGKAFAIVGYLILILGVLILIFGVIL